MSTSQTKKDVVDWLQKLEDLQDQAEVNELKRQQQDLREQSEDLARQKAHLKQRQERIKADMEELKQADNFFSQVKDEEFQKWYQEKRKIGWIL